MLHIQVNWYLPTHSSNSRGLLLRYLRRSALFKFWNSYEEGDLKWLRSSPLGTEYRHFIDFLIWIQMMYSFVYAYCIWNVIAFHRCGINFQCRQYYLECFFNQVLSFSCAFVVSIRYKIEMYFVFVTHTKKFLKWRCQKVFFIFNDMESSEHLVNIYWERSNKSRVNNAESIEYMYTLKPTVKLCIGFYKQCHLFLEIS